MKATLVAIVAGAGSGIGKATSLTLLKAGYAVVLADRRIDRLQQVAEESRAGGRVLAVATGGLWYGVEQGIGQSPD